MERHWCLTRDGDPVAYELARQHYSVKNPRPKIKQFVGPGEKVVLITECGRAIWAWRKFIDDSKQEGVCCTIFRNLVREIESSLLIREACDIADALWPGERFYTFVSPAKIESHNPGYCFKKAGWTLVRDVCGKPVTTPEGLIILEYVHDSNPRKPSESAQPA